MTEYKKFKLTKDDIMNIRDEAVEAATEASGSVPVFYPDKFYDVDDGVMSELRKALKSKEKAYRDNVELCAICEMAVLYLDEVEAKRRVIRECADGNSNSNNIHDD